MIPFPYCPPRWSNELHLSSALRYVIYELLIILFHPSISPSRNLRTDTGKKRAENNLEARIISRKKEKNFKKISFDGILVGMIVSIGKITKAIHHILCLLLLLLFIVQEWKKKLRLSIETEKRKRKGSVDFKITFIFRLIIRTIKNRQVQEQNYTQVSYLSFFTDNFLDGFLWK